MAVFMGRAAAVRAKTKARTDGAKAKNNNRYAKKIIQVLDSTKTRKKTYHSERHLYLLSGR